MKVDSNIDDVISQLKRSADRAVEQAMKELEKTAFEVEREAKLNAPVDTGMLRGSITTEEVGDGFEVFTNVEYAPFLEYGTSKMAAQPFMEPALDIATKGLGDRIKKIITEQLD